MFIYLFLGHFAFIGISELLLTARLEIREADDISDDIQITRNVPKLGMKAVKVKNLTKMTKVPHFEQYFLHRKV